jgi:hypothetical protein
VQRTTGSPILTIVDASFMETRQPTSAFKCCKRIIKRQKMTARRFEPSATSSRLDLGDHLADSAPEQVLVSAQRSALAVVLDSHCKSTSITPMADKCATAPQSEQALDSRFVSF